MNIYLDCDGVLLDWEAGFRTWAIRRLRRPLIAQPKSWDLSQWLGVTPDEAKAMIHEFNHGPEFGLLTPIAWAAEAVAALAGNGYQIHVITSCSRSAEVVMRRAENLHRYFPNKIDTVTCLDLGESKAPYLAERGPGIWVEDNYHGALAGHDLGRKTFMLQCPHNEQWLAESVSGIDWHDNWPDLYAQIADFIGERAPASNQQATIGVAQ
jgi:beta-phosphoglucomutase-like phosphatase (HAD superfamily)